MSLSTSQLELRSGDPHDACYLADARRRAGDVKGAISALKRATKRFPKFGPAWSDLARLLVKARDPKRGAQAAKMATKLIPQSPVAWSHLGNAAAALGNHRRALAAWETALELEHPQRADVQDKIDLLLKKLRGKDGDWRGFERKDGNELWAIRVDGDESTIRHGKAGEKARKQRREFGSSGAARRNAERQIAEKLREGFRRVRSRATEESEEPSAKRKSKPTRKSSKAVKAKAPDKPTKAKAKPDPKPAKAKAPARATTRLGKKTRKSSPDAKAEAKAAKKKTTGRFGKPAEKGTGRFGKSSARLEQAAKTKKPTRSLGKKKGKAPSPGKATARVGVAKGKDREIGKGKTSPKAIGKGKAAPKAIGKGSARLRGKAPAPRKRRLGR